MFDKPGFTDGYLTNGGEFLNRDQAWNRAQEAGQRNLVRAQRASGIMEFYFKSAKPKIAKNLAGYDSRCPTSCARVQI